MSIFDKLREANVDADMQSSKPIFYKLSLQSDIKALEAIIESKKPIVHDEILGQVQELVKLRNPTKKIPEYELTLRAQEYINSNGAEAFGVWVYYPWSNKLVHVLEEEEFIEVRTNRNFYKITPNELSELRTKVIGVIGLSVGQSVSLTMASERVFGELRIADFDTLELSNLNRIRSGVENLGLLKTLMVSREVHEIDPYLNIVIFSEGVNESNYSDFIGKGDNKLDLLIDECDGLDVKIRIREIAKNEKIPVLMDSSDRGMLDIERFDEKSDLPLLHGLVDGFKIEDILKAKTNEEKVPFVAPILGIETMTTRMKYSLLEIEESISTWPQLASSVTLGGGVTCHVARKILLGEKVDSGRYFIDLDHLEYHKFEFGNVVTPKVNLLKSDRTLLRFKSEFEQREYKNTKLKVKKSVIEKIIINAGKAPSGGNSQPWIWISDGRSLAIYIDKNRCGGLLDYKNLGSIFACGASFENAVISSQTLGFECEFSTNHSNNELGRIDFVKKMTQSQDSKLYDQIGLRYTNRTISHRAKIPVEVLTQLKQYCPAKPWRLQFIDSTSELGQVSSNLEKIERARIFSKMGHSDFVSEIRWDKEQVMRTRDGIDIETIDFNNVEQIGIKVAKDWNVIKGLKDINKGKGFDKLIRKSVNGAGAIGLLSNKNNDANSFFEAGRIIQRIWLAAAENSISFQPLSPATFLFTKLLDKDLDGLDDYSIDILNEEYEKFQRLWKLKSDEKGIFLFRLCIAPEMSVKSLRRNLEEYFLFCE